MFLFRMKKDNTEAKLAAEEAKVKKALEQKEKEEKARAKKEAAADKIVKAESRPVGNGKESPVKVVIPASSLKEEGHPLVVAQPLVAVGTEVPDELVDSLLVKVTREGPDESAAPALTDIIPLTKPGQPGAVKAEAQITAPTTSSAPVVSQPSAAGEAVQVLTKPVAAQPSVAKAEAKPAEAPKTPAADAKKSGEEDKGNMFSNLFGKTEVDEETYLDRLIKSLPDITIEEVMSEAEEVRGLMNEWSQRPDTKVHR